MKPEQKHLRAKDQAVRDYLRGPYKTYNAPPNLGRNVIGIGIGHKNYNPQSNLCVHCYVERKLEPSAIPEAFLIKETLGGIQTDVIEAGRFVAFQGDDLAAPGSSIGFDNYMAANVDPTITGTLGGFVMINDDYYVLGSNHAMMVNGRVPKDTDITFKVPGQFDQRVFAQTDVYVPLVQAGPNYPNHVDCALAKVVNQDVVATQFPDWIVAGDPVDPETQMKVSRIDQTDETATGVITAVNVHMRIDYRFGTYDFDDLVLIEGDNGQFAKPGDSGAILVDQATHKATALVIGGSSKYTIACPITTAFKELALAKQYADKNQSMLGYKNRAYNNTASTEELPPTIELVVNSWGGGGSSKPSQGKATRRAPAVGRRRASAAGGGK